MKRRRCTISSVVPENCLYLPEAAQPGEPLTSFESYPLGGEKGGPFIHLFRS